MRELVHPRWPSDLPTNVHWIRAGKAFGPDGKAYPGRMVAVVEGTVIVECVPERTTAALASLTAIRALAASTRLRKYAPE